MIESNKKDSLLMYVLITSIMCVCMGVMFGLGLIAGSMRFDNTSPVEENVTSVIVDSIITENDKLIVEVETLDSIKNAEIIEVQTFDNDSTVKLFYKLIRE